jgi:hypothetical protein
MKKIYFALIDKRLETAKWVLYGLLILCYPWIVRISEAMTGQRFGSSDQIYICRISFLFLLCAMAALACYQWVSFLKKYWESLTLLGISGLKSFLLFLSVNTEILFLQIYGGTVLFQMQGIGLSYALSVQVVYGIFVCGMGMLLGLKAHGKILTFLSAGGIGVTAIFLRLGCINYHAVYGWVMGEGIGEGLFSENSSVAILLLILSLSIVWIGVYLYKSADMSVIAGSFRLFPKGHKPHFNRFPHKKGRACSAKYNQGAHHNRSPFGMGGHGPARYLWMYRNREFLFWKLCSMVFFALTCCLGDSSFGVFFAAYGICLITAFYFKDIYSLEQKKFLIYFMSDYPYGKFFLDLVKEGIYLLGDNLFLVLILVRLRNLADCITFLLLGAAVLSISIFVNAGLFAKYPKRQHQLRVFMVLINLHLPIGNLIFLYQWIRQGKRNWEHLSYEQRL